ncbi:hypothetical protein ABPG72_020903 [Tetrahymena utriculariae]
MNVKEKLRRLDLTYVNDIELILNDGYQYLDLSQNNYDEECQRIDCYEFYELHKTINSIQQKNNVKVCIPTLYYINCFYHLQEFLTNQENINSSILYHLKKYSNNFNLTSIIIQRIMKGYIFNNANQYIISYLPAVNNLLIQRVYSHIISIKALEKLYRQYSLNYIPQIVYDLYEI